MTSCIEKLPCDKCGSSDALQVFEENGKYTGFCFACSTYYPEPYGDGERPVKKPKLVKTPEQEQAEMAEVEELKALPLSDRKLEDWALEYFGIKIAVSEQDGVTPVIAYYPQTKNCFLVNYKARILEPKKYFRVGPKSDVDPFGWKQALECGMPRLFITEGEFDAVALYQALKIKNANTQYAEYNPAVISLANGAGAAKKELNSVFNTIIHSFKEVILVFDQDDAGRKAAQDVLQILPHARTVTLPCKDANECVIEGRSKALCDAVLFKSEKPKNTRLVKASSLYAAAREPAAWGLSWPWTGLTDLTRGIRFGETYYFGAGVKMGKSELVNSIAKHLIIDHNLPCFLAKPEEANNKSVKMLLGKVAGKIFHDPNIPFDYEAYDRAASLVGDKLVLLSLYQHMGWDSLRSDIVAAAHDGCKGIFIDPITNLVNGYSAGETDTYLKDIAQDLAAMAKDLDVAIFIFCHLKAPLSGEPHERGGKVYSSQFAGSRAMMRSCNYMFGLEGDKNPDLPLEQRNLRRLLVLEDREFGTSGVVPLYWDWKTGLFNEMEIEE